MKSDIEQTPGLSCLPFKLVGMILMFKGCDSNFEVKCSNFKTCFKWSNYLALNNMYYRVAFGNYNNNKHKLLSNIILIFGIKENEWTYNRQLIYQQIYIINV